MKRVKSNNNIDIKEKRKALQEIQNGASVRSIQQKYNVNESTVYKWRKNKQQIEDKFDEFEIYENTNNKKRICPPKEEEVDKCLSYWFRQQRALNFPVSGDMLKAKALNFHEKLGLSSKFTASNGFIRAFKERHGIKFSNLKGEVLSADTVAAEEFLENVEELFRPFKKECIYNADETGIQFKELPRKSFVSNSDKCGGLKINKERVSLMVCANSTGSQRVPLAIIGKSANPRCFKGINVRSFGVRYLSQKSAWMDRKTFEIWLKDIFYPFVAEKHGNEPILLLLDNAPGHFISGNVYNNIKIAFFPPNVTSLIQPCDQGIIATLKKYYRKKMLRRIIADTHSSVEEFYKSTNMLSVIQDLEWAWESLKESTLKNCWSKLFPNEEPAAADESENNVDFSLLVNEIPDLSGMEEEDINHWLHVDDNDNGFQQYNDDDIVLAVKKNMDPMDIEETSNDSGASTSKSPSSPSNDEALLACNTILKWLENNNFPTDTSVIEIKNILQKK